MKNFLNRGSRDQLDMYTPTKIDLTINPYTVRGSEVGTIEGKGPLDTSDRPENTNTSQNYNNGYPWDIADAGGIFEDDTVEDKIHQALVGRELQILYDLAMIASRLRQAGYAQSDIVNFVNTYLK
jgi:hypothetical protein